MCQGCSRDEQRGLPHRSGRGTAGEVGVGGTGGRVALELGHGVFQGGPEERPEQGGPGASSWDLASLLVGTGGWRAPSHGERQGVRESAGWWASLHEPHALPSPSAGQ